MGWKDAEFGLRRGGGETGESRSALVVMFRSECVRPRLGVLWAFKVFRGSIVDDSRTLFVEMGRRS